jgi:structural maintenance of chromosome 4
MPPRRSTRASAEPKSNTVSQPAKRKRATTEEKENLSQNARGVKDISDEDEDGADEEGTPPKRKRFSPELSEGEDPKPQRKGRAKGKKFLESDEDDDQDDYEDKPVPKARKTPAKRAPKASAAVKKHDEDLGSDFSDAESNVIGPSRTPSRNALSVASKSGRSLGGPPFLSVSRKPIPSSKKPPAASMASRASTPDRSLLASDSEPENSPVKPLPPASQVVPHAEEEPKGPKSRLVIHKMALVNFKSYAGRQEIGPFHKVIYCFSFARFDINTI